MEAAPAEGALEEAREAAASAAAEDSAADRAEVPADPDSAVPDVVPDSAVREVPTSADRITVHPEAFTAAGIIAPTVTAMVAEDVSAG